MHGEFPKAFIELPWYIVLFVILGYGIAIYFVTKATRTNRDKKYRTLIYRRVSFRDYPRILRREVNEIRADMGVQESLMAFNQFGVDFYYTVEKVLSRNEEFKALISTHNEGDDQYNEMIEHEMGWVHLISDTAVEVGKRCTDVIKQFEEHHETYELDIELMHKYVVTANMLQDQYHKLRQNEYIPKTILNDIEMIYRIFFDYFELVNANVEIL